MLAFSSINSVVDASSTNPLVVYAVHNPPKRQTFDGNGRLIPSLSAVVSPDTILFDRSVEDFDLYVLHFTDYGTEFPKAQNMSPDAFIQLALQLTFYKSVPV